MAINHTIIPHLWCRCGWLEDRFGLVWQVSYARLPTLLSQHGSKRRQPRHAGHDVRAEDRCKAPGRRVAEK